MLDSLHRAKIEIVSPTFMNQRQLKPEQIFIPKTSRTSKPKLPNADETRPEEKMFDKAEVAEHEAKGRRETQGRHPRDYEQLDKTEDGMADDETKHVSVWKSSKPRSAELEEEVRGAQRSDEGRNGKRTRRTTEEDDDVLEARRSPLSAASSSGLESA